MKIRSLLGRIAPVREGLWADYEIAPQGEQNSKRWIIEVEFHTQELLERVVVTEELLLEFKLLNYHTGQNLPDAGILDPSVTPLTLPAARADIYFPALSGSDFQVVIVPKEEGLVQVRLKVDAVHSLMR